MIRHTSALALVFACVALPACSQSQTKLAAEKTGDLSNPAAPRVAPDARQVAGCGAGELTDAANTSLARRPYLQRVTTQSADVLFASTQSDEITTDVTLPDGTAIESAVASDDATGQTTVGRQELSAIGTLEPATLYCYELRGLTKGAGFITAPEAGSGAPVDLIVFGDSGAGGDAQAALEQQMHTVGFDFILHVGDVAYDDGTLRQLEAQLFRPYASLLRSFPLYAVEGNHDDMTALGLPLRSVLDLPQNGSADAIESWYSFDWGDLHVVGLDTQRIGQEQADWLESDLTRNQLPWVIVIGHKPPFSSGMHGNNSAYVSAFVPILERHGVKLVLSGHDHDYERTHVRNGVLYVVTGAGGHSTRSVHPNSMTAFAEDVTHFVQVHVEGKQLLLHAIDAVGREFDSAKITLD